MVTLQFLKQKKNYTKIPEEKLAFQESDDDTSNNNYYYYYYILDFQAITLSMLSKTHNHCAIPAEE